MTSLNDEVSLALYDFGLITLEQAEEAIANYERDWHRHRENAIWWVELAKIHWQNVTPWYKRILDGGVPSQTWTFEWIREQRGW